MQALRKIRLPVSPGQERPQKRSGRKKIKISLTVVLLLTAVGYFFLVRPGLAALATARTVASQAQSAYGQAKAQNLEKVKQELPSLEENLVKLDGDLSRLSWLRFLPVISAYWHDARHLVKVGQYGVEAGVIITDTLSPYADILGLKGGSSFSEMTAEDRIQTVVSTLDKVIPELNRFGEKISLVKKELDQIDPRRYPSQLGSRVIRGRLELAKSQLDSVEELFVQSSPLIRVLPTILGGSEPKKYLVLFQNDAEIRPTGGFITAYAIFSVDKGKIRAEKSEDIYVLDASVTRTFPLPEPIKLSPLEVTSWHLRDSNLSPDFALSMEQFSQMYQFASRGQEVDGIVAIDTSLLVDVLKVLGPVNAYGMDFTTEINQNCDCPQVIYELEKIVDTPVAFERSGRKDILGVLMLAIMQKGLQSSPSHIWPQMLQTLLTDLKEKHVLLYFDDSQLQEAVEKVGFAGRIKPFEGDYLHVNDTNFGGAKSNLFIEGKVSQDYSFNEQGEIIKTVTVEYLNPHPWSNCNLEAGELCLNGEAPIWVRLYVPKGSLLVSSSGSNREVSPEEDLAKTVFAGWLSVRPEGTASFQVSYKLPFKLENNLKLLIQKQPGQKEISHQIKVQGQEPMIYPVRHDLEIEIPVD